MFRRFALYGFEPIDPVRLPQGASEAMPRTLSPKELGPDMDENVLAKLFGNSSMLIEAIIISEFKGRPLADHPSVRFGRPPGALRIPREPLDAATVAEAVSVISCWSVLYHRNQC